MSKRIPKLSFRKWEIYAFCKVCIAFQTVLYGDTLKSYDKRQESLFCPRLPVVNFRQKVFRPEILK